MTMRKRRIFVEVLFLGFIFLSGCQTAKGAAKGVAYGVESTAVGVASDAKGLWRGILNLDNWIKENLW